MLSVQWLDSTESTLKTTAVLTPQDLRGQGCIDRSHRRDTEGFLLEQKQDSPASFSFTPLVINENDGPYPTFLFLSETLRLRRGLKSQLQENCETMSDFSMTPLPKESRVMDGDCFSTPARRRRAKRQDLGLS